MVVFFLETGYSAASSVGAHYHKLGQTLLILPMTDKNEINVQLIHIDKSICVGQVEVCGFVKNS